MRSARMIRSRAAPARSALVMLAVAVLAAGLALLWGTGGLDTLALQAAEAQRAFQNNMAGYLRQLKAGQAGALAGLLALAFGYGFFHAAGPGHGKVLIGGYGMGSSVRLRPLIVIAVLSSLAQATTAVAMVYAGVSLFQWTRDQMVGAAERMMAPLRYAAIGLIGLWLVWRGVRGLWRVSPGQVQNGHGDHDQVGHDQIGHDQTGHDHTGHAHTGDSLPTQNHGPDCGHSHGPTADQVAGLKTWRDAVVLVASVAIRPCSGALFLLIITWRMGISGAGIAGTYVMALGTASVTVMVAVLAVLARQGALETGSRFGVVRAVVPVLELLAGSVVVLASLQLLAPFL